MKILNSISLKNTDGYGIVVALLLALIIASVSPSFCVADTDDEEPKRQPQTGTLAGFVSGGFEGVELGAAGMEDSDIFSEKRRPIAGSVSRLGKREWKAVVINSSESKYSVGLRVIEMSRKGQTLKNTSYSAIIKPKERWERNFTARANTEQARLELTSWKDLSPKKKKKAEADGAEATGADVVESANQTLGKR